MDILVVIIFDNRLLTIVHRMIFQHVFDLPEQFSAGCHSRIVVNCCRVS